MSAERTPGSEPAGEGRGIGSAWWGVLVALIVIAGIVVWIVWAAADDEGALVVPQQPAAVAVEEGDTVRVTGTVREFEFNDELGEEEDFDDFDGANVIVATSVEEITGDGAQGQGQDVIDEITDGDDDLLGRQVTVVGEVDEDDVGVASFTIEEPDDDE